MQENESGHFFLNTVVEWHPIPQSNLLWFAMTPQDRSSRYGSELPSLEDAVDVWCYACQE